MQADYTVFRIPNQPQAHEPVGNFKVSETETLKVSGLTTGQLSHRPAEGEFPLYEELNNIAEELEKCRLRNS